MSPAMKEIGRGAVRTVIYYLIVLAILLLWQSGGLFIYEDF
jgi:hypothetical protein